MVWNHWETTASEEREFLRRHLGSDLPPELALARRFQHWQRDRRARQFMRRILRAFRIPRQLVVPRLQAPPYKRNARKYGR